MITSLISARMTLQAFYRLLEGGGGRIHPSISVPIGYREKHFEGSSEIIAKLGISVFLLRSTLGLQGQTMAKSFSFFFADSENHFVNVHYFGSY